MPNSDKIRNMVYTGVRDRLVQTIDDNLVVPARAQVGPVVEDVVWGARMRVSLDVCGVADAVLEQVMTDVGLSNRIMSRLHMRALSVGGH